MAQLFIDQPELRADIREFTSKFLDLTLSLAQTILPSQPQLVFELPFSSQIQPACLYNSKGSMEEYRRIFEQAVL
jgi:hypothetical protein